MPQAKPDTTLPLTACPQCGHDLSQAPDRGACPQCEFAYDETTGLLCGAMTTSGESLALILGWSSAILLGITFLPLPLTGVLAVVMTLHLTARLLLTGLHEQRRLIFNDTGVATIRPGRRPEFRRWHLFEEARFELLAEGLSNTEGQANHEQRHPRWRLTLVNAYKPTISGYLHRRGTDAPIFAEAIVFTFHAPRSVVDQLQTRMRQSIQIATQRYRALRLKAMHVEQPDPAIVFGLRGCPRCQCRLDGPARNGKCPRCAWAYDEATFPLTGHLIKPYPAVAMVCLMPGFLATVFLFSGHLAIFATCLAMSLVLGIIPLLMRTFALPRRPCTFFATVEGLQVWKGGDLPRTHPWSSLTEFHCAQVEFGQWRFAFWDHPKHTVRYSPFLFTWFVSPSGVPLVDLVLKGDELTGQMICEELARRVGTKVKVDGFCPELIPSESVQR